MRRTLLALLALASSLSLPAGLRAADKEGRLYELRTYTAAPGKLDALNARFRDHTTKLFEKHGMTNVGYFVPVDNPDNKLIYVLSYPNREAREKAWKAFGADPDWQKVRKESEQNGRLVTDVQVRFMTLTDYSPPLKVEMTKGGRVFEMRTYTATKGNLAALNERFRDHTMKLFAKHGITNVAYWNLTPGQPGSDTTLIYLLAHKSVEGAKESFAAFRKDPDWTKAREASEKKAGGPLTVPKTGVVSVLLKPTDYSPLK